MRRRDRVPVRVGLSRELHARGQRGRARDAERRVRHAADRPHEQR